MLICPVLSAISTTFFPTDSVLSFTVCIVAAISCIVAESSSIADDTSCALSLDTVTFSPTELIILSRFLEPSTIFPIVFWSISRNWLIPCASCPISSDDLTLTLLVRSPLLSLISALISLSSLLVFTIGFTTFLVLIRNATISAPIANTKHTPPVVFANAANACICLIA